VSDLVLGLLRVGLAALIGGSWVSFATAAANLRGTRFGGTIGGLPSISTFSFLFIGLNQSPQEAADATKAFPIALSFTILFLIVYALAVARGPVIALSFSILVWLGFSIPTAAYNFHDLPVELIVLATVSTVAVLVFGRMKLLSLKGGSIRPTAREILRRGLAGGAVVGTVVLLSQELGPTWGGVFAAFPAVFSLTLLFTYRTEGEVFSRAMVKPLMIAALATAFPFSVIAGLAFPLFGALLGTGLALLCVAPVAYLLFRL
jgi:hypothetical protein